MILCEDERRYPPAAMTNLANLLRGYLMGAADVVPGVSGGTVALVLGIYERLVHSIREGGVALGALLRGRFDVAAGHVRAIHWRFIIMLVTGIALAVLTLARLIGHFLEEEPQATAGLFLGLVAGSIVVATRLVGAWTRPRLAVLAATAVLTFIALGLRAGEVADPTALVFFAAGAVAVVAMILPGISGSFILLMLGMYEAVLAAVNDRDVPTVVVFVLGAVTGLALFSTLLDRMLRHHHDMVMAVLIGLMIGSMRVLWPWPEGTDTARLGAPHDPVVPVLLAIVGAVGVLAVGTATRRRGQPADLGSSRP